MPGKTIGWNVNGAAKTSSPKKDTRNTALKNAAGIMLAIECYISPALLPLVIWACWMDLREIMR